MPHLKQPIGILGGTFDPVHFGHLRMALELYQALDLAEVRLVPCYQPVHRKMPVATPEQRLKMVTEAIAKESAFTVDPCEIERQGPSYTIDTLKTLHALLPNTPFCLIMGIDALLSFSSWHQWENILDLAHLVVAHRPQYQLPQTGIVADLLKERLRHNAIDLHNSLAGNILLHPVTPLEISSTDIRKQIASGRNPRFLLPDSVYNYIKEHGTYSISRI
ncbi:MAG: nicotinate-nucleotide adenylyltransferase [Gammaproteobacteria bacterium]|nr:nicotinate-nucleotide adenylyltransferase [Gammaproteobacteria bacterium]